MAYTISAHQMGVQRTNMSGLVRHEFRDVDKRDGRETAHSNELIDPSRTEHNISVLYVNGKARPIDHSSKVTDELAVTLADGTKEWCAAHGLLHREVSPGRHRRR